MSAARNGARGVYLESILTKPFKYLVIGLIVNFGILFIAGSYMLVSIALSYNGRCGVFWFFGGDGRPCSLLEYMRQEWTFILIALLEVWWLMLLAFAVLPGIDYLIGRVRNSFNSN
jgi:hypothetical protein